LNQAQSRSGREEIRQRVGFAIWGMLKTGLELRDMAAKRQHLHPTDFACIAFLQQQDQPVSPKLIIGDLGLTSGSGTALLDRLEKAGYIRRLPNPDDRRGILVELDREAAAKPIEQYAKMQASYRSVTDEFTEAELEVVARFLDRISENAASRRPEPDAAAADAA